jgi:hypothetical protein
VDLTLCDTYSNMHSGHLFQAPGQKGKNNYISIICSTLHRHITARFHRYRGLYVRWQFCHISYQARPSTMKEENFSKSNGHSLEGKHMHTHKMKYVPHSSPNLQLSSLEFYNSRSPWVVKLL